MLIFDHFNAIYSHLPASTFALGSTFNNTRQIQQLNVGSLGK